MICGNLAYPNAEFDFLALDLHLMHLKYRDSKSPVQHKFGGNSVHPLTRKSTPIVALASSSGSHCSSENRTRRLLLPTEEFPIRSSLQLIIEFAAAIARTRKWWYASRHLRLFPFEGCPPERWWRTRAECRPPPSLVVHARFKLAPCQAVDQASKFCQTRGCVY